MLKEEGRLLLIDLLVNEKLGEIAILKYHNSPSEITIWKHHNSLSAIAIWKHYNSPSVIASIKSVHNNT
ncbi:hypothetical protein LC607_28185 [Nostoc sp. CHAB 5824]|nr:hypothetical protein [Nostoc sp. CHAB 5824]